MEHLEFRKGIYKVSTDPDKLDSEAIHAYITRSYWAKGRSFEAVKQSLENSLCFGLYDQGKQIGLARIITDKITFAYLLDVYVLEEYQGQGLGKWLMECVFKHPMFENEIPVMLATSDAHGLYRNFGFESLPEPKKFMRRDANV